MLLEQGVAGAPGMDGTPGNGGSVVSKIPQEKAHGNVPNAVSVG